MFNPTNPLGMLSKLGISKEKALSALQDIDFAALIVAQLDKVATFKARAFDTAIENVNIIFTGNGEEASLHIIADGQYRGELTHNEIFSILKPPFQVNLFKQQLIRGVQAQLVFLTDHFAKKYEIDQEDLQLVTQHFSDAEKESCLWVRIDNQHKERLSSAQLKELLAGNFEGIQQQLQTS